MLLKALLFMTGNRLVDECVGVFASKETGSSIRALAVTWALGYFVEEVLALYECQSVGDHDESVVMK